MSSGQIHLFAYSKADYAAKASLCKALDPTSALTLETLNTVVQSGRALCRT